MSEAGKMWGGRFAGELDPQFSAFQKSLPVDKPLVFADLEVNRAWAAALGQAGVLTENEVQQLHAAIAHIISGLQSASRVAKREHAKQDEQC